MRTIILIFFSVSLLADCLPSYKKEIDRLEIDIRTNKSMRLKEQMDSLKLIFNILNDISSSNSKVENIKKFSEISSINPITLKNIFRRANKRDELCKNGKILNAREIINLIKRGELN